jgi:hypothetical protein
MRNKSVLGLIIGSFLLQMLSSCTNFFSKTIELDDESYDKKMVMYCFANQEENELRVSVSQNFGLTETVTDTSFFLPNAQLILEDGSGPLPGSFVYDRTSYHKFTGAVNFVPGKTYVLKASNGTLTPIEGESTMPSAIVIDTVKYTKEAGSNEFGNKTSRVEVVFQDPSATKNYYALSVSRSFESLQPIFDNLGNLIRYDTITYVNTAYSEEPRDPSALDGTDGEVVLTDDLFDGQKYQLRFTFTEISNGEQLRVRFRHITEAEYRYRVSESRRRDSEGLPLVEPTVVYSNVKDGIGVFGLSWSKTIQVE